MSTRQEHPSEGCLFSAMSSPEEIALKINAFLMYNIGHLIFTELCSFYSYIHIYMYIYIYMYVAVKTT